MNICVKFESEEAAKVVLYRIEGVVEADPERGIEAKPGVEVPNFRNIDIIGTIYKPTGATQTIDGMQQPVMVAQPGYHCNVLVTQGEDASVLTPYIVVPATRVRVWAGEQL
jgi:hypothetical protein